MSGDVGTWAAPPASGLTLRARSRSASGDRSGDDLERASAKPEDARGAAPTFADGGGDDSVSKTGIPP